MPVDLTEYERGLPFNGDAAGALAALQHRISHVQLSQMVHRKRTIIVLEGLQGGRKREFLKILGACLDPAWFAVTSVVPDRRRAREGHWLAQFWAALPEAGHSAIFFHSWYRRVLEDKVLGLVTDKEWKRAFDEINEFEAQQKDYGTLIVKLFFHVSEETRARRIEEQAADEWKRHLLGPAELRAAPALAAYRQALGAMLAQSDTRWAPWSVIDANDGTAAELAGLGVIADAMEKAFGLEPPDSVGSVVPFATAAREQAG